MTDYLDEQIAIAEQANAYRWRKQRYGNEFSSTMYVEDINSRWICGEAMPNIAEFIAASGTHRLAELRALKLAKAAIDAWQMLDDDRFIMAQKAQRAINALGKE